MFLRRGLTAFILALCLLGCSKSGNMALDSAAPDFNLASFGGETEKVRLSDFKDRKAVMLAFWATWCPPCVEEVPALNHIHEEYNDRLEILAINVGEDYELIEEFQRKHPFSYKVLLDEDEKVAESYGISGLPVIVILAKNGEIIYYGFNIPDLKALLTEKNI